MNKEINDINFLKEKLDGKVILPESLSGENIERLIENEKPQRKSTRGTVRRFVAAAVAACIVITAVSLSQKFRFAAPESLADNSQQSTAVSENSYDELLGMINDYKEHRRTTNKYYLYTTDDKNAGTVYFAQNSVDFAGTTNNAASSFTGSAGNEDFGKVNLRVENVQEADIFITDGEYLYCADKYGLGISVIKAEADGTLTKVYSHTEDTLTQKKNSSSTSYKGLYLYENYLIAAFDKYIFEEEHTTRTVSGVKIYDITDKSKPVLIKELAVDGNYSSSRITDGQLLLISCYRIEAYFYDDCDDAYFIPATYNGTQRALLPCDCISYDPEDDPEAYVNIAKINLSDISQEMTVTSYLGTVQETYCTKDSLFVIGFDPVIDTDFKVGVRLFTGTGETIITRMDITSRKAKVTASCSLEGNLLNSYSIDEYDGHLRVALNTEKGNRIVVLDKELKTVGELSGIAEGEQIKSARFMGDTVYLVTFVQTDPLFVIDLKNPEKPEILGEVKLPGFSSYLHPVGDGLLLGVGTGGTETGVDGSAKISLFDVSDPAAPKEADNIILPDSYLNCSSKAFCKISDGRYLIVYSNTADAGSSYNENGNYSYYFHTGCIMVSVGSSGLELENSYLVKGRENTTRATFIGDKVYIMSNGNAGIASFDMQSGKLLDTFSEDTDSSFLIPDTSNTEILF